MNYQSTFEQELSNGKKMGAYYTDLSHCERMAKLLRFPVEEVCVLDPSIGDAKAVLSVTQRAVSRTLFGIEINENTCKELEDDPDVDFLLNEDFLYGVEISNSVFTFCFANPPYGMAQDSKERYETLFLEKLTKYLAPGAVLVFILPHYVLKDEKFIRRLFSRFTPLYTFRFDEDVYKSFKQVAVFARKRNNPGYLRDWLDKYYSSILDAEKLPLLPEEGEIEPIEVYPSAAKDIELFTTKRFRPEKVLHALAGSPLHEKLSDYRIISYSPISIGRPPVPLSKSQSYLTAVSGGGQGMIGTAESHDIHLQRGVVKVITEPSICKTNDGCVLKENIRTVTSLNIIENDGSITCLS